jgi:hypothetical protein
MNLIIGWERYETKFKGETISMELLPLKVEAFALLSPFMRAYSVDQQAQATANVLELQGKSGPILNDYVRNMQGITVNGITPTTEILTTEVRLSFLVLDILQQLFIRSLLLKDEEKNLGSPSVTTQTAENIPASLGG